MANHMTGMMSGDLSDLKWTRSDVTPDMLKQGLDDPKHLGAFELLQSRNPQEGLVTRL